MKTKEELVQEFELTAFKMGDYKRLNQYLWLETISDNLEKSEVIDRLLVIHADEEGY